VGAPCVGCNRGVPRGVGASVPCARTDGLGLGRMASREWPRIASWVKAGQ
jgi:hypothetical protein